MPKSEKVTLWYLSVYVDYLKGYQRYIKVVGIWTEPIQINMFQTRT